MEAVATEPIDLMQVRKVATYSLPMWVWLWLKQEAESRETNASALIAELVRKEQEAKAA